MTKKIIKKLTDRILKRQSRIKVVDKDGYQWYPKNKEWSAWTTHTFHQKEYDEELEKTEEEFKKDVEEEIERFIREAVEHRWHLSKRPTPGLKLEIDYTDSVIEEVIVEEEIEEAEKVEVEIPVEKIEREELEEVVKPIIKPIEEIKPIKPTIPVDVQRRLDRLESLKREAEMVKGPGWEKEVAAYERAIRTIKEIHGI